MPPHDLRTLAAALPTLTITPDTTSQQAMDAHRMLGSFNDCTVGLVRFERRTPWEWHREDELLHVLEGEVELTLLGAVGPVRHTLVGGSLFVVPRETWHRQDAHVPTTLLFATPAEGNRHSGADDPRGDEGA
jgi:quercetin dioxygenase-like cupin family protein